MIARLLLLLAVTSCLHGADGLYRIALEVKATKQKAWDYSTATGKGTLTTSKASQSRYLISDADGRVLSALEFGLENGQKVFWETTPPATEANATRSSAQVAAGTQLVSQSTATNEASYAEQQGKTAVLKIGEQAFTSLPKLTGPVRSMEVTSPQASKLTEGTWTTTLDRGLTTKAWGSADLTSSNGSVIPAKSLELAQELVRQTLRGKGYVAAQ
jgi:hypothetical protein